jgi:hypothetical protein
VRYAAIQLKQTQELRLDHLCAGERQANREPP